MTSFIAPNFKNIPQELLVLDRWVTWKTEYKKGEGEKPDKVPYCSSYRHREAKVNESSTWSSFAQAKLAYEKGNRTGVGIVLNGDGLVGIDLDRCVKDGVATSQALALMDSLGATYIEVSPSGTGLRALGYGEQLESGINGSKDGLKAEFYSSGRYLTLTGKTIKAGPLVQLVGFKETAESFRTAKKTKVNPETGEIKSTPSDERQAALINAILTGDVYHDSLRDLAASWVSTGMHAGATVNSLRGLMHASQGPHDDRWAARLKQIPDLVSSASSKFMPLTEDFDALVSVANDKLATQSSDEETGEISESSAQSKPFKLLTVAQLNALPPLRWRIRGVLPETGLGMILGASTAGKTFVALDMAAHISLGLDWNGFKTKQAPVVYVALEGERGVQHRVTAWESHHVEFLPDSFRFVLQSFDMLNLQNVADLVAAVLAAGGRDGVIIIDTLNRATPGADENSSVDMGNTIAAAKRLQSATNSIVILVHHKGKNDAAGARGHSSLYAALDAAIAVNCVGKCRTWSTDPSKGGKSKDGEAITKDFELKTVPLGLDDEGLPVSSAVVAFSDAVNKPRKLLTHKENAAMQAYFDIAGELGVLDANDEFAGLHVESWRSAVYATSTADSANTKKKSFQNIREQLVKKSQVSAINDFYLLETESFRNIGFADMLLEKRKNAIQTGGILNDFKI